MAPSDILRVAFRKLFPPMFTIRVRDGKAAVPQGRVTRAFLEDCSVIAGRSGIGSGWIWGLREDHGVRLEFSSGIRDGDRQRFRNTAGFHRL